MTIKPGDIYKDKAGRIWKVIAYCPEPSVTLECIDDNNLREVGMSPLNSGINGLLFTKMTRLVPMK